MKKISSESLKPFATWEKPTLQDVVNVMEKLNLSNDDFPKLLGINVRSIRRWTSKKTVNRLEKSAIPYGTWCILVALAYNKIIFADVKKCDLLIPDNYICNFEKFVSPPKEILTLFVGRKSFTGLQRTELASLFGWNATHLGSEFNNGNIKFLNWVLLLLLCGVNIKKLINIKK